MGSYSPPPPPREEDAVYRGPEPQILPPGAGTVGPPGPVRRERAWWASAPATYVLVAINCGVFLWMLIHHVSYLSPTPDQLMAFGANNAGAVLNNNQWWRIVSAMFVHVGIIHLATNMWCLWNLGMLAEPLIGFCYAGMVLRSVRCCRRVVWSGRSGGFWSGIRYRRRADCPAQVTLAASASWGVAKTSEIGDLFCGNQPGDWFGDDDSRLLCQD